MNPTTQKRSASVWLILGIIVVVAIGAGIYEFNGRTSQETRERATIDSLIASWRSVSKTFSSKAGESGNFNNPDKIQFISSDTMLVHYDDGLVDHISVVQKKDNSFVELKNIGVKSVIPLDSWVELVKTYGDIHYRPMNYHFDVNKWVLVPENTFVVYRAA
jgi:hypothetical protein